MPEIVHTILTSRAEPSAADRRASPRIWVALRVDYADAHGRAWWSIARNFSYSGLFLAYPAGLSVGDTITLTLVLPTGQSYKGQAHVVHLHPVGAGLQFVEEVPRHTIL